MKTLRNIILIFVLGMGLIACEKNDPIADQGSLTGNMTPFNLLAQMPDAKVNDTLVLRTVCWSINDDIEEVSFFYQGYKLKNYSITMGMVVNDEPVELSAEHKPDTIFIENTLIKSYPEEGTSLNAFYQTIENAYVIEHPFIVPGDFTLYNLEDSEVVDEMSQETFDILVAELSLQMNRAIVLMLFPSAPASCFEFDQQGFYTGNLTEAGFTFVQENMTRELLIEYLSEASLEDTTRGTIESVATVAETNASATSARNFKILK
ncbi:MAG: hypothetical protein V2I46_11625 [Bacteroides sp.]|jgi:hypothetical protein|nr:hypothetical protein [Bacteroides sp.]